MTKPMREGKKIYQISRPSCVDFIRLFSNKEKDLPTDRGYELKSVVTHKTKERDGADTSHGRGRETAM
jgi:hypothetical protein